MTTRGFTGRRNAPEIAGRLPPGQYLEKDFPVLSAGPTPHVSHRRLDVHAEGRAEADRDMELGGVQRAAAVEG